MMTTNNSFLQRHGIKVIAGSAVAAGMYLATQLPAAHEDMIERAIATTTAAPVPSTLSDSVQNALLERFDAAPAGRIVYAANHGGVAIVASRHRHADGTAHYQIRRSIAGKVADVHVYNPMSLEPTGSVLFRGGSATSFEYDHGESTALAGHNTESAQDAYNLALNARRAVARLSSSERKP